LAKAFDPRKLLKDISNPLLGEFFERRGELIDMPWDELKQTEMEDVFHAWQELPDQQRKQVQVILQDLAELSEPRGLKVIVEEVNRHCPERLAEVMALEARLDKAMWFHLNMPEVFEETALFARADSMSNGRYAVRRNGLPTCEFCVTHDKTEALQLALQDHYWPTEMRGRHCKVNYYPRGELSHYFFAYLDDWPDRQLVFEDDGELEPRSERYAFSNMFVFCPTDGSLELIAAGGQDVHFPLQRAFCQTMLGIDVGPADPWRPVYKLGILLDHGFQYPTNPTDRIKLARLARIRVDPISNSREIDYLDIKFSSRTTRQQWLAIIDRTLECNDLTPATVVVKQASFQLIFMPNAQGREKKMTFNVSVPNTCNLKDRPDEQRLAGEHCLQLWGILDD
jgi:hypothetical protein